MRINRGLLDETLSTMFSSITYKDNYLFYAHLIGKCSIKIEDIPAPAGVAFVNDHYNLYINPELFDTYTLENRLAILQHEMLHIVGNHINRAEDRIHLPWNYATDCAINQFINQNHLPENCILPENFPVKDCPTKQTAEVYYDLLKQESENNKCNNCESDNSDAQDGSYNTSGKLIDTHETWNNSTGDKDLQNDITKKMLEHSMNQTIKDKGKVPNEISQWLETFTRKAEINWKNVLRGIVGNKKVNKRSTITRRDRRFPYRDDLRGKTRNRMFNLLVISDVSGSVSNNALISLWSEIIHICDVTKTAIDVIQIDTEPSEPEKLSKNTKVIERKSSGGTYLNSAINKAKESKIDYNAVVVTTDGFLFDGDIEHFKKIGKRIIWLIEKNGQIMPEMNSGLMQAFQLKD